MRADRVWTFFLVSKYADCNKLLQSSKQNKLAALPHENNAQNTNKSVLKHWKNSSNLCRHVFKIYKQYEQRSVKPWATFNKADKCV